MSHALAVARHRLAGFLALNPDGPPAAGIAAADLFRREAEARQSAAALRPAGLPAYTVGRVAVLPLWGYVTGRPGWATRVGLAVAAGQFADAHAELVADPAVSAVVWDVDSPGGSVAGVPEAADRLFALRGRKPTVAVSNTMMASAAYWLASAADEVVAAPSSQTGSIGVYLVHEDYSRALDKAGVAVTYVYAGARKIDGNPDQPLSDPARAGMQRTVNDFYGQFTAAVARHRRTSPTAVAAGYGEGDVLTARRAVAARLADRVGTLPDTIRRLASPDRPAAPSLAAALDRHRAALTARP